MAVTETASLLEPSAVRATTALSAAVADISDIACAESHWAQHSTRQELCCPEGHLLVPTALRFYQGFVRSRGCGLCGARIWRDEVRHRCESCNFDVCLRCFERHHLQRARGDAPAAERGPPDAPAPGARGGGGRCGGGGSSGSDGGSADDSASSAGGDWDHEADGDGRLPAGAAGRGALAIPEAIPSVSLAPSGSAGGAEPPAADRDLRRFLRPGDVLNYLGGNAWGHTVLVLGTPQLCEVPALFDAGEAHERLAQAVPAYVTKVLQSASNMLEISVCTCCLVVHPRTQQVCPAKETRGGLRLLLGRDGSPMHVDVLLSPFNALTLDLDTFRLAVEEVQRAPQDCKWSFKTAVRSYLKDASIDPRRYQTRDGKRKLAAKLSGAWRQRPVCSTVPPRVWQKYLLKARQRPAPAPPGANRSGAAMARGRAAGAHLLYCGRACGPLEGPQCADCLSAQWASASDDPDPEVAWVEDLLRLMPVRDDRVLPRELAGILLDTRLWRPLDLHGGPPEHRRGDGGGAAGAAGRPWSQPLARAALPPETRNAEGAPVRLGGDGFTVYCGRQVSRPTSLQPRFGHDTGEAGALFQWDGRCGPELGPQCAACRRLEDRLLA